LERLAELNPTPRRLSDLADAHQALGQWDAVLKIRERLVGLQPVPQRLSDLADAHQDLGQWDAVLKIRERLVGLQPVPPRLSDLADAQRQFFEYAEELNLWAKELIKTPVAVQTPVAVVAENPPIGYIPDEILYAILDFFESEDLTIPRTTCKTWFNVVISIMRSRLRVRAVTFTVVLRELEGYRSVDVDTLGEVAVERWKELIDASNEIKRSIVTFEKLSRKASLLSSIEAESL
jgi:tetratricopeptide (TPR) repeat protein